MAKLRTEAPRGNGFDSELSIQAASPTTWRLTSPLIWTGTKGDQFTVPIGFVTDFATVPRFLIWKTPPYGAYTRAAVLHDWLLTELATWHRQIHGGKRAGEEWGDGFAPPADSRDCDGIFRRVMEDLKVPWLTRWEMWAAVRLASCFSDQRSYGRRFWLDAPRVFAVAVLSVVPTLIGAVPVLASLAISWPFTRNAR